VTTDQRQAERVTLAAFAGTVSRWCSLTGNVPDVTANQSKQLAELDAFSQYLDHLAARKRNNKPLQF
jgi:hypothetical protein